MKAALLNSDHFQHLMDAACAGFEVDCKQACRGLKVSIAVKVFGMGTLIPNNFADENVGHKSNSQHEANDAAYVPETPEFARRPPAEQSSTMGAVGYVHR